MANADELVPIFSSLETVYGEGPLLDEAQFRFDNIKAKFIELYGKEPQVYARAPGRVNLIGEHIDYEGYSVLPMAIRQDTIVAIHKRDPEESNKILQIANVLSEKYGPCTYAADPDQDIDLKNHKWAHYFLCGYKGIYECLKLKGNNVESHVGLDVLIDGTVPAGSGLSSSAALVCSSAIGIMAALNVNLPKKEVAQLTYKYFKIALVDVPDRTALTDAWKVWMEEHINAIGKVPPGNESGNTIWVKKRQTKPDLRLTPGRHVQLTVTLEQLIDKLVKENEIVVFIKGSRTAPQCGFSHKVLTILNEHGLDYESVNILDEDYNPGLRETLKVYSSWPTFPQVFIKGEFVGGADILTEMAEKGELQKCLKSKK